LVPADIDPSEVPVSVDLPVLVLAESASDVDRGRFTLVVGANVGASAATSTIGRFHDLLGEVGTRAFTEIAAAESSRTLGVLRAELAYMPHRPRAANVAVRSISTDHEIAVDVLPGVPPADVIALDDLVVGVEGDRLVVRRLPDGAVVQVTQGHMLSLHLAPAVVRFLNDVTLDAHRQLTRFDWGPAAGFPYLPRVQRGRIVLSPARWQLEPAQVLAAPEPEVELDSWRHRWGVPDRFYITRRDNRLLVDCREPEQLGIVWDELRRAHAAGFRLVLEEPLPDLHDAWMPDQAGFAHVCELVVPLVRSAEAATSLIDPTVTATVDFQDNGDAKREASIRRIELPGGEWLYVKLYCAQPFQSQLIAGALRSFAQFAMSSQMCQAWFFVRYVDPEPHLRVRFRGRPATLAGEFLDHLLDWARQLVHDGVCTRFSIDTYERELERYGGPLGMPAAEAVFAADSTAVADLLRLVENDGVKHDLVSLAVLATDDLLAGLGLDLDARAAFYREVVVRTPEGGTQYRRRKAELRELLAPGWGIASPSSENGPDWTRVLMRRRVALSGPTRSLDARAADAASGMFRSFVHMHANRLLGLDHGLEHLVLELLQRTTQGFEAQRRAAGETWAGVGH
jgi:thiopeptide-type bacteriocin biosynthesis protein